MTQQAEHLQRRKEIWEAMQEAEAKEESGKTFPTLPGTGRGNTQFAAETSAATGVNKSTVTRATRRAREVCQAIRSNGAHVLTWGQFWDTRGTKGPQSATTANT